MTQLINSNKVLMKFGSEFCQPCKILDKSIQEIIDSKQDSEIDFQFFDIGESPEVFKEFNVRAVPTIILMDDAEEVKRATGAMSTAALLMFIGS